MPDRREIEAARERQAAADEDERNRQVAEREEARRLAEVAGETQINTADVTRLVREALEREPVDEVISNNTIDDGFGTFITTVIFRSKPLTISKGFSTPRRLTETRYLVFVDGKAQSGGGAEGEWEDVEP